VPDEVEISHGVEQGDNEAWKNKGMDWTNAMWQDKGNTTKNKKKLAYDPPLLNSLMITVVL
jgi:hypothetical protein